MPKYLSSCKGRFVALTLIPWIGWSAWSASWVERQNQEADPGRPLGWRFQVPDDWRQGSLSDFPYPLGESWAGKEGILQVCWLGSPSTVGSEQISLESRGYARADKRVGGRDATLFQKQDDTFCYVKTGQGVCRLHLTGSAPMQQKIMQSFTFLQTAKAGAVVEQRFANWSFELPPGWAWQAPDTLVVGGEPVCKLVEYPLERDQMVRGWARNQAGKENPKLKERTGLEPFSSKHNVDGYLAEWKGPKGPLMFAYAAREQKGFRAELLRSNELDRLRRLVTSLRYHPQAQP